LILRNALERAILSGMDRKRAMVLAAFAACLVAAIACTRFEEAAAPAPPDAGANPETGPGADAQADAGASCGPDAGVLLGSTDVALPKQDDSISEGSLDAHQFVAGTSGTATCMHLFVREWPSEGTILVGVYEDVAGSPKNLLAQTKLVDAAKPTGWTRAPLDKALTIATGSKYWLGFYAPSAKLVIRSTIDAACPVQVHNYRVGAFKSELPPQFVMDSLFAACEAAAFLSP
jgi:hypothetical protein